VPRAFEIAMHTNICIESCPSWFRVGSLAVYLAMPLFWGVFAVFAFGRSNKHVRTKPMVIALFVSALVISGVTWMAYAYQK
jgi:hypothetical protein